MKYLIIPKTGNPFYTNWYDYKNNHEDGMIAINLYTNKFTRKGEYWDDIEDDSL